MGKSRSKLTPETFSEYKVAVYCYLESRKSMFGHMADSLRKMIALGGPESCSEQLRYANYGVSVIVKLQHDLHLSIAQQMEADAILSKWLNQHRSNSDEQSQNQNIES